MPRLMIGTRSFEIHDSEVAREADRMFKLSPDRRTHRLGRAKTQLARAGGTKDLESAGPRGAVRQAVAIILSQAIEEI